MDHAAHPARRAGGRAGAAVRQWDRQLSKETIQRAIEDFYAWYEGHLAAGTMKPGSRLGRDGKLVSRGAITDGPFTESKEVIGGYWISIAAQNPCLLAV